jgi:hypothetical protein
MTACTFFDPNTHYFMPSAPGSPFFAYTPGITGCR